MTRRAKSFTRTDALSAPSAGADDRTEAPSKSARKRQMHALQNLGDRIAGLSPEQWRALALPEPLVDALHELGRLRAHEARRRQLQFIGKLMREIDPAPIEAQLERWEAGTRASKAAFKAAERWRERLLTEPAAVEELLSSRPDLDRAAVVALVAEARRAPQSMVATTASRKLFRLLHASFSSAS
ncbi:MAG: ribosome biogenesis factor YjgA [Casimicrobiaceae bacterium]